ncbi:hypothetical protein Pcinc_034417 [Petrolisthes cinctipes]|uniref:Uncharacterized protein n=1 Tax=Petrolisthes cinctipes TaxID=88211 RepID=A0AAE1EQA3_PETCI|nr:hypothetical protein Pcinc_034417 [Petrolisthes cinctipes]
MPQDPSIRSAPPRFLGVTIHDITMGVNSPPGINNNNNNSRSGSKRTIPPPTPPPPPPCSLFLLLHLLFLLLLVSTPTTRASGETGTQGESPLVMVTSSPSEENTEESVTKGPLGNSSYGASNSSSRPTTQIPQQEDTPNTRRFTYS